MTDLETIRSAIEKLPSDEPLKNDALFALGKIAHHLPIEIMPDYGTVEWVCSNIIKQSYKDGSCKYYDFANGSFVLHSEYGPDHMLIRKKDGNTAWLKDHG